MSLSRKERKQQEEELVRTQVLNLDDVRRVAKYERRTSKKPAAVLGLLGIALLVTGAGAEGYVVYSNNVKATVRDNTKILEKKLEEKETQIGVSDDKKKVTCTLNHGEIGNGTATVNNIVYTFKDNKLISEDKEFISKPVEGNEAGVVNANWMMGAFQQMADANTTPGYQITVASDGANGFTVTTAIDLAVVDITTIPQQYQDNLDVRADFAGQSDYDTVINITTGSGYTCK